MREDCIIYIEVLVIIYVWLFIRNFLCRLIFFCWLLLLFIINRFECKFVWLRDELKGCCGKG